MYRKLLLALTITALASPSFAQDVTQTDKSKADVAKQEGKKKKAEERKKKAAERKKKAATSRKRKQPSFVMNMLKPVELTDEQKPEIKKVAAAFDPKFNELRTKQNNILTDEQKKAIADARAKQREARRSKGKESASKDAAAKAKSSDKKAKGEKGQRRGGQLMGIQLTDEQIKQRKAITTEQRKLRGEVLAQLKTVLTEEQQALLPGGGRKQRPKKRKKPEDTESKKPKAKKKDRSEDGK